MKRFVPVIILGIVSLFAIKPLFSGGYYPMHDDTQVARVVEMGRALSDYQFPVRWVGNLGYGYGYPIFNFYAPLPYYAGGILFALGLTGLVATKIMFGFGFAIPAFVMYAVAKKSLGWQAGLTAALLYLLFPYHAVQLYVRGAVGEYWTLLFWPLIFAGITGMATARRRGAYVLLTAVGIGGSVVSHTLMGYVTVLAVAVVLAGMWVFRWFTHTIDRSLLGAHLLSFALGLGLSAFFWMPAVAEMGHTNVAGQVSATADYADHFVCVSQLWTSVWGFGGSAKGCLDGMSFMIGKAHIAVAILSVLLFFVGRSRKGNVTGAVGALLFALGAYFATAYSEPLWRVIPGFSYLQYPWRFLALSGFGISLLGAYAVSRVRGEKAQTIMLAAIAAVALFFNMKWFVPQFTYGIASAELESENDIRWRASRISDEYLPKAFVRPEKAEDVPVSGTMTSSPGYGITVITDTAAEKRFIVEATRAGTLTLTLADFPGWRYFVENKEVTPTVARGLPVIPVDAGQSQVSVRFTDTRVRSVANVVTFLALLYCGVFIYEQQRKAKR